MSCGICLTDICKGGCCTIEYKQLQSIEYGLKLRVSEIADSYIKRLKEGYSCSPNDFDYNITSNSRNGISKNGELLVEYKEIKNLLSVIQKEIKNLYTNTKSCICKESLCKIKDTAIGILGVSCYDDCRLDLKIDSSNEEDWIANNPYCVSRENWEKLLYRVCNDMKVTLSVVKKRCDIVYDVVAEYRNCDIDYTLDSHILDCTSEFNIIKTDLDCDITFDVYRTLRDCGISFSTISEALNCGITFDIDRENNCPMIVTLDGGYSLCNEDQNDNEQLRNIIRTFSIN